MSDVELRSGARAGATGWLWPELGDVPPPPPGAPVQGVGGRQAARRPRRGGGGYLNGRTPAELRSDPRLRELAEIGLAAHWLAVARIVGYDAFLAVWRLLSEDPALRNDDSQIELTLRPYRSFEKYQRNRYIDTLVLAGMKPSEILALVRRDLGETLSHRHIRRLAARSRQQAMGEEGSPVHPWHSEAPDTVADR